MKQISKLISFNWDHKKSLSFFEITLHCSRIFFPSLGKKDGDATILSAVLHNDFCCMPELLKNLMWILFTLILTVVDSGNHFSKFAKLTSKSNLRTTTDRYIWILCNTGSYSNNVVWTSCNLSSLLIFLSCRVTFMWQLRRAMRTSWGDPQTKADVCGGGLGKRVEKRRLRSC